MEDATLETYLSRLAINVETIAFSTAPLPEPDSKGPTPKELLSTEVITSAVQPVIVRQDKANSPHIYVVWKVEIFMSRSYSCQCQVFSDMQQVGPEDDSTSRQYTFNPQHP
jgi:hypothetical protein